MITLVSIIVLLTFLHFLFLSRRDQKKQPLLFLILCVCLLTEIVAVILKCMHIGLSFFYAMSFIVHNSLWLKVIIEGDTRKSNWMIGGYFLFALLDLFVLEKNATINKNIFIVGALLYVCLYLWHTYKSLTEENLGVFTSHHFLLISAPVLFFLGMSLLFAFISNALTTTIIFGKTTFYTVVNNFVNVVYYFLMNLYIYLKRKPTYA